MLASTTFTRPCANLFHMLSWYIVRYLQPQCCNAVHNSFNLRSIQPLRIFGETAHACSFEIQVGTQFVNHQFAQRSLEIAQVSE